jgi:hypothetical protein
MTTIDLADPELRLLQMMLEARASECRQSLHRLDRFKAGRPTRLMRERRKSIEEEAAVITTLRGKVGEFEPFDDDETVP